LEWTEHVLHDDQLMRPNEIAWSQGNPEKAQQLLGWQATKSMSDVIKILCSSVTGN
jgi:GDPmannose 4,6-dehydratase